jgi:hypothetical protein
MYVNQRCPSRHSRCRRGGGGAVAADFFKDHRGSGRIFFEDIEKMHEFDRISVFTNEIPLN